MIGDLLVPRYWLRGSNGFEEGLVGFLAVFRYLMKAPSFERVWLAISYVSSNSTWLIISLVQRNVELALNLRTRSLCVAEKANHTLGELLKTLV